MDELANRLGALTSDKQARFLERLRQRAKGQTDNRISGRLDPSAWPLSFGQERLWFLDQLDPGNPAFNIGTALRLAGNLDVASLADSLAAVITRHEALRAVFPADAGTAVQRIRDSGPFELPLSDLSDQDPTLRATAVAAEVNLETRRPFDLVHGPLVRAKLLRLADDDHVLIVTLHHIVADGWSLQVLVSEVAAHYAALRQGIPVALPSLPIQYADYASWQRQLMQGEARERQLTFWQKHLAGAPPLLSLPTDHPRPAVQTFVGGRLDGEFDGPLTAGVRALCRDRGVSSFIFLLTAMQVLFARLAGQDQVVIGAPIANRHRSEVEPLIGIFINTLAFNADISENPPFATLLEHVRTTVLEGFAHQDLPFEHIIEALQPERSQAHGPIFQVMLNVQNFTAPPMELPDLTLQALSLTDETIDSKFDLTLYVQDRPEALSLAFVYNAGLFQPERIALVFSQFQSLVAQIVAMPERPVKAYDLASGGLRDGRPDPAQPLVPVWTAPLTDAISRHAVAQPDRLAVADAAGALTYAELDRCSNQVAHWLALAGLGSGAPVAILATRNRYLPVALLGSLKAGTAFVILDPQYPASRLEAILLATAPAVCLDLVGDASLAADLQDILLRLGITRQGISAEAFAAGRLAGMATQAPDVTVQADQHAYIAFTSGTTGGPKGIIGTHRPLAHFVAWQADRFGLTATDRFVMLSGLAHDPLLRDILTPLWLGASLHVPDPERMAVPGYLAAWLTAEGATTVHLTPAMAQLIASGDDGLAIESLRWVFCGGDRLTGRDTATLARLAPKADLVTFYGTTETPQAMAYHVISPAEREPATGLTHQMPIGTGIDGVQLLILTETDQLAGIGEVGEIVIRTPYLSVGYLDDTTMPSRFTHNPLGGRRDDRCYRTGDLGRYGLDGSVTFVGRRDGQVKVRGFRVELSEIEAALCQADGIRDAVVVARPGHEGETVLDAYLVAAGDPPPLPAEVRETLCLVLPSYMLPATYTWLNAIPLTPNGKLDRRALPTPVLVGMTAGEFEAPLTPTEVAVAGVWQEVLGADRVGRQDDFFLLGGHSLLAVRVVARLRLALHRDVPLRLLFDAPLLTAFATGLDGLATQADTRQLPPLLPVARDGNLPASDSQQRMWLLQQLTPDSIAFNNPMAVRAAGPLAAATLTQALGVIVGRHEALRTHFQQGIDGLFQVIGPTGQLDYRFFDLGDRPESEREAEARRLVDELTRQPFDMATGPLCRFGLIRLTEGDHVFVAALHHAVSDGWSGRMLSRELLHTYQSLAAGTTPDLPPLTVQYADYAAWERQVMAGPVMASQVAYWQKQLAEPLPVLELPTDHPRPATPSSRGGVARARVSGAELAEIQAFAHAHGVTLFMVLLSAMQTMLYRYTGQDDLIVGTPVANRTMPELEPLIGYFGNNLALRSDLSGAPSFAALVAQVRETTLQAFGHQDVSLERVQRSLGMDPRAAAALMQAMLVLQNLPSVGDDPPGFDLTGFLGEGTQTAKLDVTLYVSELPEGLGFALEYRADLFEAATADRMVQHLRQLLLAGIRGPETPVGRLPMLEAAERQMVLAFGTEGATPFADSACIHELIAAQAEATPQAVALTCEGKSLTYADLTRQANQVAHHLIRLGVQPEQPVAVVMERSPALIVSLLGILTAGAAYVPIDPHYPPERIAAMLADSQATCVLTQSHLVAHLPSDVATPLVIDALADALAGEPVTPPAARTGADGLAVLLYTSGSTGTPKGVMLAHRGIVNHGAWLQRLFAITPDDRILHQTTLSFDNAIWEIFGTLMHGARLVIAKPWGQMDPAYLVDLIASQAVTHLCLVPTLLQALLETGQLGRGAHLRGISVGGEALPPALMRRMGETLPTVTLVNTYGPTEATIDATFWVCDPAAPAVLIGRPVANAVSFVLDDAGQPVPVGVPGELCVGGVGLARGYWRLPDLTAERFLPNPFGPGRIYRTGDRVRWQPDGRLAYLGRNDDQIKLRGQRIEPGEIETVLRSDPLVGEAVVLVRTTLGTEAQLVAYVTSRAGGPAPDPLVLLDHLRRHLPQHMVPAAIVPLEALPLTLNGKVDRRALPAPAVAAEAGRPAFVAPRDSLEAAICAIWEEVLHIQPVGIADSFFALGGHSLLATQVLARMQARLHVEVPLRDFFSTPTVAALAAGARRAEPSAALETIAPADHEGRVPLSYSQQRLWFLDQLDPDSEFYNIATTWRITGALDTALLVKSVGDVVARHQALRTRFDVVDGVPYQIVDGALTADLPIEDLRHYTADAREAAVRHCVATLPRQPFKLFGLPLFRMRLLLTGDAEAVIVLVIHHIIADGWSIAVLLRDLAAHYSARRRGEPVALAPLTVQYPDFAVWQRRWMQSGRMAEQLAYWKAQLSGVPQVLDLPTDRARPATQSHRGARTRVALTPDQTAALRQFSAAAGVTPYMTLMATFQALLGRYSRQERFLVGTPIANRARPELEALVGFFVNTLVIPADLREAPSFQQLVARVREATLGAYANQDLPFEMLVTSLQPDRSLNRSPLFQVMFVLQNVPNQAHVDSDLSLTPLPVDVGTAKFDLVLELFDGDSSIQGYLEYNTDIYEESTAIRLAQHLGVLLDGLLAHPERPVDQAEILEAGEREQLLTWHRVDTGFQLDRPIQDLFTRQVEEQPMALAVRNAERSLTYRELDRRANQLANRLHRLGVGSGARIGVCLERSNLSLPIAILGILKAGGTYVPLDPKYPVDRLAYMIGDSGVSLVLTQTDLRQQLPMGVPVFDLDPDCALLQVESERLPAATVLATDIAYVIYTSGSTGRPKGVPIRHDGLCNLVQAQIQGFGLHRAARTLQFASTSFDASISEIFTALVSGGELHLASNEALMPGDALTATLHKGGITHATLPPSVLALLDPAAVPALTTVISAGEACTQSIVRRWASGRTFINAYGPTEVTVCATLGPCHADDPLVTIGTPLPNVEVYILDDHAALVPIGVPGELCVGGIGVSPGYLNRPDLTAERFIPHPYAPGTLYRTGDLARYRADGTVEYLGRTDQQVKIRGFRIEPGEIESVLMQHPAVTQAVVEARPGAGGLQLVAYLVLTARLRMDRVPMAQVCMAQVGDVSLEVRTRDLSYGGVCLVGVPAGWRTGAAIRVGLSLPGSESQHWFEGEIAWSAEGLAGIRLDAAPEQRQILHQAVEFVARTEGINLHEANRSGSRLPMVITAAVEFASGRRQSVQSADLSYGGICVVGLAAVPRGELVRVRLQLPGTDVAMWFDGAIAWQRGDQTGLRFDLSALHKSLVRLSMDHIAQHEGVSLPHLRHFLQDRLPDYMVPARVVLLEALPLTPNGKVDRKALPRPEAFHVTGRNRVQARNHVEMKLVRLWETLLQVSPIGVTDNFFELGGHSLLAVQLMARLEADFGRKLPLAAIFEGPTVERLAELLLRSADAKLNSTLVPIQPRGSKPPLFCVHPVGGSVLSYAELARLLGQDQPFFGLQAQGLDGDAAPRRSIPEMAEAYVAALRDVQETGPYYLAGWSMGGVVAYEMARQLSAAGESIGAVFLFDSYLVDLPQPAPLLNDDQLLRQFARDIGGFVADEWAFPPVALPLPAKLQHVLAHAKAEGLVGSELDQAQLTRIFAVFAAHVEAMRAYVPEPFSGRLVLFRARFQPGNEMPDATLGWGKRCLQAVEVDSLPADHYTMLRSPYVDVLAERLRSTLQEFGDVAGGAS